MGRTTEGVLSRNRLRPKLVNIAPTITRMTAAEINSRFFGSKSGGSFLDGGAPLGAEGLWGRLAQAEVPLHSVGNAAAGAAVAIGVDGHGP